MALERQPSVAAARQGAAVAYLTAVGHDVAGERFLDLWRGEGIDEPGEIRQGKP